MRTLLLPFLLSSIAFADTPKLPGIGEAMQEMIAKNEVAGAVTVVANKEGLLHLEASGMADIEKQKAMSVDTMGWIASMTKPITGVAIMMLQDEGKLNIADPVAKHLPEFAALKTHAGKAANLTITQILTHTSGLGEAGGAMAKEAHTLADLVPIWLATPMQYEPGEKWQYCQSGINAAARIVEVISGMTFDEFLQKRLFNPLGMTNTTFYRMRSGRRRPRPTRRTRTPANWKPCRHAATSGNAVAHPRGMAACIPARRITPASARCCSMVVCSMANAS